MRAFALQVVTFVGDATFDDFYPDSLLRRAVERNLEIIGEAANRVSRSIRDAHPEIAWAKIIGLRNVLAHGYSVADGQILWQVATQDVNELIAALDQILGARGA